jgi:dihydrofolate reductase
MAKTLYSATMSLDGFIAGAGGDMSWLSDLLGADGDPAAERLVTQVGAILAGNRTATGDDPNKGTEAEGAFGGEYHGPSFVLTHNPPAEPLSGVTYVTDLADGLAQARAAAGDKYVNVLGADVARQCLEAGELDEVLMFVAPVLLGDGTRMFQHPGGTNVRLERFTDRGTPHWYRVVRQSV